MAKIVDPDQLNQGTEVVIDKTNKTIQLLAAGNLSNASPARTSGVSGQAVYSFIKEEWLADATLNVLKFPFDPVFEQKLQLVNGWKWADATTRELIRDAGWSEIDGAQYAGVQSLGNFDATTDQAYYQQVAGFDLTADNSVANFAHTGDVNEGVQIVGPGGSPSNTSYLKLFLRVQGKTYSQVELVSSQALSQVDFRFYGMPLENEPDITDGSGAPASDSTIDGNAPYTGMSVAYLKGSGFTTWANSTVYPAGAVVLDPNRQSNGSTNGTWWFTPAGGTSSGTGTANDTGVTDWESYAGAKQIGTEWYAFNVIVNGNGGTKKQIYEWAQRQLRKTVDINADDVGAPNQNGAGAQYGRIANSLCNFVGSTLHSRDGVYIDNFNANDTNDIVEHDITVDGGGLDSEGVPVTSTNRTFPFVAAGTLQFSDNLVAEPDIDTLYKMFFKYTVRVTGTDIASTSPSGSSMTLTSTTTDFTTQFTQNEFIEISGFANSGNNGIFQITSVVTANSMTVTRTDGQAVGAAETAGSTINLDDDPFDSPDAVVVNDNSGTPITGQVTASSVNFDFDYDGNVQGGRSAGTDAPVVVVAQGKAGARWQFGEFTITRSTGLSFPVNTADELVYSNPA